jgi:hypothetical protein
LGKKYWANIDDTTMKKYDPLRDIDPKAWLALDEDERMVLVRKYHRRAGIKVPNARLHAIVHVIVENQVAMGDVIPVRRTLERLQKQGLDRHDAVHAIASVLADRIFEMERDPKGELTEAYYAELEQLTPESWYRDHGSSEADGDDP